MATQTETLVRNLRVKDMRNQLPDNVFPIKASIELRRTNVDDRVINDREDVPMKPPQYPVTVNMSVSRPYIERTTVYFRNPAAYQPKDKTPWYFEDFVEKVQRTIEQIKDYDPTAPTRFYLLGLDLCEVPEEYAYTDSDGYRNVRTDSSGLHLYKDYAQMGVASFRKRPKIPREVVTELEEHSKLLPGNVIKPLRLDELKQVNAKPHRGTPETTGSNTTTQYFTEAQAKKFKGDKNVYPRDVDPSNWPAVERTLPGLANHVPEALADGDGNPADGVSGGGFLGHVKYDGHYTEDERFVIEGAQWTN